MITGWGRTTHTGSSNGLSSTAMTWEVTSEPNMNPIAHTQAYPEVVHSVPFPIFPEESPKYKPWFFHVWEAIDQFLKKRYLFRKYIILKMIVKESDIRNLEWARAPPEVKFCLQRLTLFSSFPQRYPM